MSTLARRIWTEPALIVAVLIGAGNAALLLPDWKAAVGSMVASLAGGIAVRQSVVPLAKIPAVKRRKPAA
jgi:hypothetical protein